MKHNHARLMRPDPERIAPRDRAKALCRARIAPRGIAPVSRDPEECDDPEHVNIIVRLMFASLCAGFLALARLLLP